MSFASRERVEALDLRATAADAAGQRAVREVDLRERLDLAVEDDREVLRRAAQLAADPLVAGDLLEPVRALPGELHRHDRATGAAGARVEVRPRARELQVLAGHLRDVRRVVLEEVVPRAIRRDAGAVAAGADDRALAAGDDDHALGNREELTARGKLAARLLERLLLGAVRAGDDALRLRVDDVAGVGLARPSPATGPARGARTGTRSRPAGPGWRSTGPTRDVSRS